MRYSKHIVKILVGVSLFTTSALFAQDRGDSLFQVQALSISNPFALAPTQVDINHSEGALASNSEIGSPPVFLVDTTFRPAPFIPPLTLEETFKAADAAEFNPFALAGPGSAQLTLAETNKTKPKTETAPALTSKPNSRGWLFYVMLSILAYLTLVVSVYREEIFDLFSSFVNINMAMQSYRDRGPFLSFHDLLLYLLFIFCGGTLIFLIQRNFNVSIGFKEGLYLLMCMGAVALIYILKHLQLLILSAIFPFGSETSFYSYLIGNANKSLGVALVPMIFLVAYSPEELRLGFTWLAIALCGAVYIYRSMRALVMAGSYLMYNKFHFFMYLCAVEVAPIIVLIKLLLLAQP